MKKMLSLGILMAAVVMMIELTGCKSYLEQTTTTEFRPDNTVLKTTVIKKKEDSPFRTKSMTSIASVLGIDITIVDPQTASTSPSLKLLDGDSIAGSVPVTSGNDNAVEIFATYKRSTTYSTSVFSQVFGTALGDFKDSEEAGGLGVFAIGKSNPSDRIKATLDDMKNIKAIADTINATQVPAVPK